MDHQANVARAERRTREEIRQIVAEFATSGMQQSEFCRSRGISRSTLDRHLRKQRTQDQGSRDGNRLLAVEVRTASASSASHSSGLVVALSSRCRIEVNRGFDAATLERLLTVLDKV
jgi:transposase-like protein